MIRFAFVLVFALLSLKAEEITVDAIAMTKAHNDLRKKYGSPPLTYSKNLEDAAKKWAAHLQAEGCAMVHSQGAVGPTGENLYWASASKKANVKDEKGHWLWQNSLQDIDEAAVVQGWYDEVQWYDYETNSCEKDRMCGHYTQVIWNTTTELGCAATACTDRSQVWVCEYAPAGNVSIRQASGKVEKLRPY